MSKTCKDYGLDPCGFRGNNCSENCIMTTFDLNIKNDPTYSYKELYKRLTITKGGISSFFDWHRLEVWTKENRPDKIDELKAILLLM